MALLASAHAIVGADRRARTGPTGGHRAPNLSAPHTTPSSDVEFLNERARPLCVAPVRFADGAESGPRRDVYPARAEDRFLAIEIGLFPRLPRPVSTQAIVNGSPSIKLSAALPSRYTATAARVAGLSSSADDWLTAVENRAWDNLSTKSLTVSITGR